MLQKEWHLGQMLIGSIRKRALKSPLGLTRVERAGDYDKNGSICRMEMKVLWRKLRQRCKHFCQERERRDGGAVRG